MIRRSGWRASARPITGHCDAPARANQGGVAGRGGVPPPCHGASRRGPSRPRHDTHRRAQALPPTPPLPPPFLHSAPLPWLRGGPLRVPAAVPVRGVEAGSGWAPAAPARPTATWASRTWGGGGCSREGRPRHVDDGPLPARPTHPTDTSAMAQRWGCVPATATHPWRRASAAARGGVRSNPLARRRPRTSKPTDARASVPRGRVGRTTPRRRVGDKPRAVGEGGGAAARRRAAAASPCAAGGGRPPFPVPASAVGWLAKWGERPVGVASLVKVAAQLPPQQGATAVIVRGRCGSHPCGEALGSALRRSRCVR